MFCDGAYEETYDLYRPTLTMSAARDQKIELPDTPTESSRICRFIEEAGSGLRAEDIGLNAEYDALLFIPPAQDLRPYKKTQQPDVIYVDERWWNVLKVWTSPGGNVQKAALQERRNSG